MSRQGPARAQRPTLQGLRPYSNSITGKVRDHNEDSVWVRAWPGGQSPMGLDAMLAVADGMGGHQKGEWASQQAIAYIKTYFEQGEAQPIGAALQTAFTLANRRVFAGASGEGQTHPGTTLTVAALRGNHCWIGHVGDSRAYIKRGRNLWQLTRDDTWAAELVRTGEMTPEKAKNWAHKHQLSKAIGVEPELSPAISQHKLEPQDILLLCSDGLHGLLSDEEILSVLCQSESAASASAALCQAANQAGGTDNISVALVSMGAWPRPRRLPPRPFWFLRPKDGRLFLLIALIAFILGAGIRLVLSGSSPVPVQTVQSPGHTR